MRVNFADGYPSIEQKVVIDDATPETLEISFELDPSVVNNPEVPVPIEKPKPVEIKNPSTSISKTILFAFDQAAITESSRAELLAIVAEAKKANHYTLTIIGHTDDAGSNDYNQKLSERRAKAVADFLPHRDYRQKLRRKENPCPL